MATSALELTSRLSPASSLLYRWRASPRAFATEGCGIELEPWQAEAFDAITKHDRIAIRSGHGVGKSTLLALTILWFHVTRTPAKTACTAPTAHQLSDVLWAELSVWLRRLTERHPPIGKSFEWTGEQLVRVDAPRESFAVARTARKEAPEAFQGVHSEHTLLIGDEASGIPEPIFEAGIGAMSTPGAKTILTGNPTRPNGFFYDCFHSQRSRWFTMRVSSEDVPRARGHIDDVISKYGRDSNAYRVRVLGEFPTSADEQVIPLDLIEAAVARQGKVEPIRSLRVVWGVDVARFGDDRTTLAKRRGNTLLEPVMSWRGKDLMQTCGLIADEWKKTDQIAHDELPSEIIVDVIGYGAGVVDRLNELSLPARGHNVGEGASIADRYMRRRDELWFKGREWFQANDVVIPRDEALIAELVSPTYTFTSAGKIAVEPKSDTKDRLGYSPDLADAFLLTLAGGLDRVPDEQIDRYRRNSRRGRSWMAN